METTAKIDAIGFSVMLNRLEAVVNEMSKTLERAAVTPILALSRDFSCAISAADGREAYVGSGLPIQIASMHLIIEAILASGEAIEDGDLFMTNDPWRGNTHVGDLVTAAPVFSSGELCFWVITRAHQMDVGAYLPASITPMFGSVYEEGLRIPPLKIRSRGVTRGDVMELYLSNMRYRQLLEGDLLAQMASLEIGRLRLDQLCAEYGVPTTLEFVEEMMRYSARRTAESIREMPDGTYVGESWMDGSGSGEEDVLIRATVTIAGERAHVDFSGSAPQVAGGTNGTEATSTAAGICPILYCLDPDIPHNHGCFSQIEVHVPIGSVCRAEYPASTSCATVLPSDAMQEAVTRALTHCVPEKVIAGTARCGNVPEVAGRREDGEDWVVMYFNNAGGGGAARGNDGWPMLESWAAFGGIRSAPVEELELLYPLRFEEWEIEPETIGHGQWTGAPGSRLILHSTEGDVAWTGFGDGQVNPPHGAHGGLPGSGGGQYVLPPEPGVPRTFLAGYSRATVPAGHRLVSVSTGGGGYGSPLDRDPEAVRRAVRDELLDRDGAAEIYGVLLDGEGELDREATERRRQELESVRESVPVLPTAPRASEWLRSNMREGDTFFRGEGLSSDV